MDLIYACLHLYIAGKTLLIYSCNFYFYSAWNNDILYFMNNYIHRFITKCSHAITFHLKITNTLLNFGCYFQKKRQV